MTGGFGPYAEPTFMECRAHIYCEAGAEQPGWKEGWNANNSVTYGFTRAQFDALDT